MEQKEKQKNINKTIDYVFLFRRATVPHTSTISIEKHI
jgi:hypothetical protein